MLRCAPCVAPRPPPRTLRRAWPSLPPDREALLTAVLVLWNVLLVTLALPAELGRGHKRRLRVAKEPVPRLIASIEELEMAKGEAEWPLKESLQEGILCSQGFQAASSR